MKKSIEVTFSVLISVLMISVSWAWAANEIREYEGKRLSPFNRNYDNSIKGPQTVNINTYRLEIGGLVRHPLSLSYKEILAMPSVKRSIVLHCVEGWDETLLFKGVRIADLIRNADLKKETKTIIFYAADGYSSSLTYEDVVKKDMMIAYEINGIPLDATRGFPLQVVAESKWGYKWVKWVTRIELSDKSYKGYWENRGYDNDADVNSGKK
jgi:DMSO/TMAO reductase YedYZ molybdopterin-dependent catalytic subunit